jgi:xylulokinase
MTFLLGIDLGTSSAKAVIIDDEANVLGVGGQEYPILSPHPGWAEQDPETWWTATVTAVRHAVQQANVPISAISLCGQMHGGVLLDGTLQPMGSAIIWADQRSAQEVDDILSLVGRDRMAQTTRTAPATGFMAATLLWLLRHDPELLNRAVTYLLPKDYIRFRLTNEIATEPSDASATALFDVPRREWSHEIVNQLGLPARILPPIIDSSDVAAVLQKAAADVLGLPVGLPVVAGCADQVAQAIGNGLLDPGDGSVTLGSGGQLFIPLDRPLLDPDLTLHTFCHAPLDRWYLLGAMLTAGLSLRWLRDLLGLKDDPRGYEQLASLASSVPPGAEGLVFLPYLAGERSPLMDPLARGCFIGLTLRHEQGHLARAIMEGVAFAFRQIMNAMIATGAPLNRLLAAGNGLASPVWRQIVADVLARPLYLSTGHERTGVGAALLAGIGTGAFSSYAETRRVTTGTGAAQITEPISSHLTFYDERYQQFKALYPLLRPIFHDLRNP